MTPMKKMMLFGFSASLAVAAVAFAQTNAKIEALATAVGAAAPAYALPDQDGKTHTLAGDKGKIILLAFYPKDFTGGCTIEAHSLTTAYPSLKALGVTVYGVSVQDPTSHKSFCSKEGIPYTLLADTDKKMSTDYGVLLPGANLAKRVTYIVGADGKVAYVDKAVNGHLNSCGADWAAWIKAHPAVKQATTPPSAILNLGTVVSFAPGSKAPEDNTGTHPLAVGTLAPDYQLPDSIGKIHTLAADRGHTVLLEFYPADFTFSCSFEARNLTLETPELQALGVRVYGVSVQSVQSHADFAGKEKVTYPLLSDATQEVTKAYGLLMPVAGGLARRVTYIISPDGKIAYADTNVNAHLATAAKDWTDWIKANLPVQQTPVVAETQSANNVQLAAYEIPTTSVNVWRSLSSAAAGNSAVKGVPIGQKAYDFTLPDVTSSTPKTVSALAQGKKVVVLMFLSTQCPISNAYNERMVAVAKKYGPQGVAFVGIDANKTEPTPEVAAFTKQHGFPFPVLKDADDKVADAYDAHVTPETYVIDSKGVLVYHGRIDNDMDITNAKTHELADALDATLAGKPVAKSVTKAFGCTIKRG